MATKPWDGKSKRVLTEIPQDTVDWLLPGAKFVNNLSPELEDETVYHRISKRASHSHL
jgi:hypothetical protein